MNIRKSLGLAAASGLLAVCLVGCSPGGTPVTNTSVNTTGTTTTTGAAPVDTPVAATTTAGAPSETGTPTPGGTGTPGETPSGTGTPGAGGAADAGFEAAASQPGYDDVKKIGKNPVPSSPASIAKGQQLFTQYCASCHGESMTGDGPAAAAITTGPPRNLTLPDTYKYGHGDLAIFRTAKYGIPGTGMAPVAATDDELWNIVDYVRSKQQ